MSRLMNRHHFINRLSASAAGAALTVTACKKSKPNIILIVADDLGYGDLGCYGQKRLQTPHIDRLAADGIRFVQHYSGSTVCAPSRSCLMTGLHTGHTPIRGNKVHGPEGQEPLPAETITVAKLLKKAGYATGAFGKWGLGSPGSKGDPMHQGFDEFFGFNCQRLAHNYYPRHLWHNQQKISLPENNGSQRGVYAPQLIHQKTIEFMQRHHQQPFFLYVPTIIPHAELTAPESYLAKHRGRYQPEKSYVGVDHGPTFRQGPYASQPECHAAFAGMIHYLDDQVGEIVDQVKNLGIEKNTLILFSSDNGPHLEGGADPDYFDSNGPLRGYKRDLTEGGIRVPLITCWPGHIQPRLTTNHIATFWDFLPTACDLADITTPKEIDGISYAPTLLGERQTTHDYRYWEFHERTATMQAVRMGKWKWLREGSTVPAELYNLDEDIAEGHNLADQFPDVVERIHRWVQTARQDSPIWPMKP